MLEILLCVLVVIILILVIANRSKSKDLKAEKYLTDSCYTEWRNALDVGVKQAKELSDLKEKLEAFTLTYSTLDNKYSKLEKTYNQLVEDTAEYMKLKETPVAVKEVKETKKSTTKKETDKKKTTKKETSKKKIGGKNNE